MGALGLAPPQPRCRWEPLQPPLLWLWESLRQKQKEKQLEGGCSLEPFPPTEKIQMEPKVEGEESGEWREDQALLKPQIPG